MDAFVSRMMPLALLGLLTLPAWADAPLNQYQPVSLGLQLQLNHEMRSAARSPLMSAHSRAIRQTWAEGLHAPQECEDDFAHSAVSDNDDAGMYLMHHKDHHIVMEFMCSLGAYQGSYQYAVLDMSNPDAYRVKWITIPQYTYDDKAVNGQVVDALTVSGLPEWDEKQPNQFSLFSKARGIGDCGSVSDYILTDDYSLELTQVKARDCDNEHMPSEDEEIFPTQWPVVYRKK